jgi:hypothetical protein
VDGIERYAVAGGGWSPTTIVVEPSKRPPPIKESRASTPMTERLAVEVGWANSPRGWA